MKIKYVMTKNGIIVFPINISHSYFKNCNPTSAGFIYFKMEKDDFKAICYGESGSLGLKSNEKDSLIATKQLFNEFF